MSRNTHINRRISSRPLWKALAVTACAAGGLIGLAVSAAATQAAVGAPSAVPPNQASRSAVALAFDPAGAGFAFYRGGMRVAPHPLILLAGPFVGALV